MTVATYLLYLALTAPLTVWVARALHRHGQIFLIDVFAGDERLARAVNQLLVIGFYLLNLGYVARSLTTQGNDVVDTRELVEVVSLKVGTVAMIIGVVHLANVWAFNAFRKRALLRARALPPVVPNGHTAVAALDGLALAGVGPAAAGTEPTTAAPGWAAPGSER